MKRILTNGLIALVLGVGMLAVSASVEANEYYSPPVYPDIMYNYYVQDPYYGFPAKMYPSPIQTPPVAGYTYTTYPPFAPHEFLYRHHRTYYHYYNGGQGLNRTHARWYGGRTWLNSYNPLFLACRW